LCNVSVPQQVAFNAPDDNLHIHGGEVGSRCWTRRGR